jgi:hypothetical protein
VYLVDLDVVSDACKVDDDDAVPSPPAERPSPRSDADMADLPNDPFVMGFC